jgi:hypothetical protein
MIMVPTMAAAPPLQTGNSGFCTGVEGLFGNFVCASRACFGTFYYLFVFCFFTSVLEIAVSGTQLVCVLFVLEEYRDNFFYLDHESHS